MRTNVIKVSVLIGVSFRDLIKAWNLSIGGYSSGQVLVRREDIHPLNSPSGVIKLANPTIRNYVL
jgi:hypothetical protein